jgi:hypothetical protein
MSGLWEVNDALLTSPHINGRVLPYPHTDTAYIGSPDSPFGGGHFQALHNAYGELKVNSITVNQPLEALADQGNIDLSLDMEALADNETFITNVSNNETLIHNISHNETFLTNVANHETFITNVTQNESFITNVSNHETLIHNISNNEIFLTNVANHETFITNLTENQTFKNTVNNYFIEITHNEDFLEPLGDELFDFVPPIYNLDRQIILSHDNTLVSREVEVAEEETIRQLSVNPITPLRVVPEEGENPGGLALNTGKGLKVDNSQLVTDIDKILKGKGAIYVLKDWTGALMHFTAEELLVAGITGDTDFLDSSLIMLRYDSDFTMKQGRLGIDSPGLERVPYYNVERGFQSSDLFKYNPTFDRLEVRHARLEYKQTYSNDERDYAPTVQYVDELLETKDKSSALDLSQVANGHREIGVRVDDVTVGIDEDNRLVGKYDVEAPLVYDSETAKMSLEADETTISANEGTLKGLYEGGGGIDISGAVVKTNLSSGNDDISVDNESGQITSNLQADGTTIVKEGNTFKGNYSAGGGIDISGAVVKTNLSSGNNDLSVNNDTGTITSNIGVDGTTLTKNGSTISGNYSGSNGVSVNGRDIQCTLNAGTGLTRSGSTISTSLSGGTHISVSGSTISFTGQLPTVSAGVGISVTQIGSNYTISSTRVQKKDRDDEEERDKDTEEDVEHDRFKEDKPETVTISKKGPWPWVFPPIFPIIPPPIFPVFPIPPIPIPPPPIFPPVILTVPENDDTWLDITGVWSTPICEPDSDNEEVCKRDEDDNIIWKKDDDDQIVFDKPPQNFAIVVDPDDCLQVLFDRPKCVDNIWNMNQNQAINLSILWEWYKAVFGDHVVYNAGTGLLLDDDERKLNVDSSLFQDRHPHLDSLSNTPPMIDARLHVRGLHPIGTTSLGSSSEPWEWVYFKSVNLHSQSTISGHMIPSSSTWSLGSQGTRWGTLFAGSVNLSNLVTARDVTLSGTNDSTDPSSGSLVVGGGAGIGKDLHVGGDIHAANLGALASQNSVAYADIEGTPLLGQLAFQDYVDAEDVGGLGDLATKDVVDWNTDIINRPIDSDTVQAGTGLTLTDNTLSVNASQPQITTVGTIDSTLRVRNTNSASISVLRLLNDNATDSAFSMWINGSTRSLDGGGNAASLRNNLGELRLQSQGGNGIRIAPNTGDVTIDGTIAASNLGNLATKDAVEWKHVSDKPEFFETKSGVVPPAPMTSNSTNLEEGDWLAGEYTALASSVRTSVTPHREAWKAFDPRVDSDNTWHSSQANYDHSGYTGTITTTSDAGSHLGEWIQIGLPRVANVTKMELRNGTSRWHPKDLTLLGSSDGIAWTHLASMALSLIQNSSIIMDVPQGARFKFLRMVIHSTHQDTLVASTGHALVADLKYHVEDPPVVLGALASKDAVEATDIQTADNVYQVPPSNIESASQTMTFPPDSDLDGVYIASASTFNVDNDPWKAFRDDLTWGWTSDAHYEWQVGTYLGAVSTLATNGTTYSGEWLQLQTPMAARMHSFHYRAGTSTTAMRSYSLLGSNNGTTWDHIITGTAILSNDMIVHSTPSTDVYNRFRIVVHESHNGTRAEIRNIIFYLGVPSRIKSLATKDVVNYEKDIVNIPPRPMPQFRSIWNNTLFPSTGPPPVLIREYTHGNWGVFPRGIVSVWASQGGAAGATHTWRFFLNNVEVISWQQTLISGANPEFTFYQFPMEIPTGLNQTFRLESTGTRTNARATVVVNELV